MARISDVAKNFAEGTKVVVRGKLSYCRYMTNVLDGSDLANEIKREEQYSSHPEYIMRDPKLRFTLVDPKMIKQGEKPNDLEIAFSKKIYSTKNGEKRLDYQRKAPKNKSGEFFLPYIFGVKQENGKIKKVDLAGVDLANDQVVTLTYTVYETKKGLKGLDLSTIVFDEEPKLYQRQSTLPDGWEEDDDDDSSAKNDTTTDSADDDVFD
jgi:hypothetical protein